VTKCCEFSEGRIDVHNEQRSGRPSLISDYVLQKTEGEIRVNLHKTEREIHHIIPKASNTTIHEGVVENLRFRKLCALCVPNMLTDDHKTKQICITLKYLMCYAEEGDEFLDAIVTGEETWVFFSTFLSHSNEGNKVV
jgi:isocitrate dehydrogenase kinase/phosphatase